MKRILVVEDTWHNRKMLRDLLTRAGFEVLEAASCEPPQPATSARTHAAALAQGKIFMRGRSLFSSR